MIDPNDLPACYAAVWESEAGRAVLTDVLLAGRLLSPTQGPRDEGARDVALHVFGKLVLAGARVEFATMKGPTDE